MANVKAKNADGTNIYLKADGAGSDGDPHIPEHLETNSAAILAAAAAIQAAAEALAAALDGDDDLQVDVLTLPTIPAGTNLIGRVSASPETSTVYDGTTALTPKFAAINVAGSGDNTILAAVTSKKIRVLQVMLMVGGTVNVRFESGAGGTALTGIMELIAQTGFVLPYSPVGWFETASNTLLNLELSAAVNVDGLLVYVEV